ncbi:hypothetical protein [Myxococcus faecalis]|uniref:hypothetical protein n=1 Tax=Myxococcus faecalis TaxID=3115646 RepID=UPI003CF9D131
MKTPGRPNSAVVSGVRALVLVDRCAAQYRRAYVTTAPGGITSAARLRACVAVTEVFAWATPDWRVQ